MSNVLLVLRIMLRERRLHCLHVLLQVVPLFLGHTQLLLQLLHANLILRIKFLPKHPHTDVIAFKSKDVVGMGSSRLDS